jgi:hypothetical protein
VNIYPSEGIINLFDFIQRNLYNMKVKNPRHFGDLLRNRTYLLNHYTFDEGVIPRFSDNYSKQMEKAIRRCKAVFRSFEKGTWNGHKYELTPFYLPNVVIHQEKSGYSVESGVIHPNLSITYSGGWPILDGQKLNQVLPVQLQDDFMEYIRKRFKQFDITFS